MRITVGSVLLGDLDEAIPIGGFSADANSEVQRAKGRCAGMPRLRVQARGMARYTVPTKRTFESVSAAQKYIVDTAALGAVEGRLQFDYADGATSILPWAVATPSGMTHRGVLVTATWSIDAGERLV